ncbi:MAG: tRNA (adenosine(37)-N6)-threonylcarbamoyltransferase complex ATPase subunit type 1 TsaE [Polyangiaceae bacterium]|nr:tRNA (adenosine(37)-N6)-threonylcarbamoyltransferase complex ATPase subunit type 1 TsaE [Polyangiaceae bacterium]
MSIPLPSRRATKLLARALALAVKPGDLVIVSGPLGAGKTFLVRAALRELGLPEEEAVASPTFSLVHDYDLGLRLVHADLYRLGGVEELPALGLSEERDAGAVLLVEWGEPYVAALGGDALAITIRVRPGADAANETSRSATLEASGTRSRAALERMRAALGA